MAIRSPVLIETWSPLKLPSEILRNRWRRTTVDTRQRAFEGNQGVIDSFSQVLEEIL